MRDNIAYCGLDCEACEARMATVNNDEALRQKVAKEWSVLNGVEITPEMINCSGCRVPGVKTPFCDWIDLSGYSYITLRDRPSLMDTAAQWFHEKWVVPKQAYLDCMSAYLNGETEYGWYLCLDGEKIVGGLGVIENDFHDRKDLAPNVCAVYTEEAYRGQGIAGRLLNLVVTDMKAKRVSPLYLVTDHIGFYERYGWEFYCPAHEEGTEKPTRVYIKIIP